VSEPTNGGREQAWLDTLTEAERSLIRYTRGMTSEMRDAWMVVKVAKIESVLDNYTAKALSAQSVATNTALSAANPPAVVNGKGNWTITQAQRTFWTAVGIAVATGILIAGHALGRW
jgi:hypothetical protein